MITVELSFRITGRNSLPCDHAYALYGAISRKIPEIHGSENKVAVHPVCGRQIGNRLMVLTESSRLILRVEDGRVVPFLKLAGSTIQVGEALIQIGVPEIRAVAPAPALRSRIVVIKVSDTNARGLTRDIFEAAARKQLSAIGMSESCLIHVGTRRTVRIKQREIVGYEVIVGNLTDDESLALQRAGIGGRRKLGCGVFLPSRKEIQNED